MKLVVILTENMRLVIEFLVFLTALSAGYISNKSKNLSLKTKAETEKAIKDLTTHVDTKDAELKENIEVLQKEHEQCILEIRNGIQQILQIISKN